MSVGEEKRRLGDLGDKEGVLHVFFDNGDAFNPRMLCSVL